MLVIAQQATTLMSKALSKKGDRVEHIKFCTSKKAPSQSADAVKYY
ncbi:MAG: hypothetical protein ACI9P5_000254 [Saprospiraceae bacterium]|jgi:hypothetical protein